MFNSLIHVIGFREIVMKRKGNHLGIYILLGLLLCFGTMCPKMIAFAGGINSNEAGVISAASGTFTYDGKTYKAGSAHINSLTSYLAQDDIDLTAEQASEAISTMYGSIAQGIAEGYLYEVGGTSESTEATTQSTETVTTQEEDTEEDEDAKKKASEKKKADSGEIDIWETMSSKTEAKENLKNRPKKADAAASVELGKDDITVVTKDNKEINISKTNSIVSSEVSFGITLFAGIILAITIICGIILFATKCMTFKKRKSRRARPGHSKRRKIRRHTRNVLTFTATIGILGIFSLIGIYISVFNKDATMQNMQSSGYFRYAYSEYISQTNDTDAIVDYEDYLFTIKQNSMKILDGETNIRIPDSNVTPYIYNFKSDFIKIFWSAGIWLILSTVLSVILMIFMDQKRERGLKHITVAELIASVVIVIVTAIMAIVKPYMHMYIEPDYLYLFLMECIHWSVKVMISISAFGVVVGMLLFGIYKTSYKED